MTDKSDYINNKKLLYIKSIILKKKEKRWHRLEDNLSYPQQITRTDIQNILRTVKNQ
jgi:hypothetical protein